MSYRKEDIVIAKDPDPNNNNEMTASAFGAEVMQVHRVGVLLFSFILWLIGIVITYSGLSRVFQIHKYVDLPSGMTGTVPFLLVGFGVFIVVISSSAFFCIFGKGRKFFLVYAICLMFVLLMNVGLQISLSHYEGALNEGLAEGLNRSIQNYNSDTTKLDLIQSTFQCCGIENSKDWIKHSPESVIPKSCYIKPNCDNNCNEGCRVALETYISEELVTIFCLMVFLDWYPIACTLMVVRMYIYIYDGTIVSSLQSAYTLL